MATKALNINQHIPLHQLYPDNCCLCKAENRVKELEKNYVSIKFHEQHLKENKEYYEKEITKLKEKLFLSKETCDVCFTSSFMPVPKNTKGSLKVKGKDYNVICQMCEADETLKKLFKNKYVKRFGVMENIIRSFTKNRHSYRNFKRK